MNFGKDMSLRSAVAAAGIALVAAIAVGCSDDSGNSSGDNGGNKSANDSADKDAVDQSVDEVVGDNDIERKGDSPLDIAAYSLATVQSEKYSDYEVDGSTARFIVRDGVEVAGSECVIITAALGTDHPDATFIVVADGEETVC